jgi:Fic family protein
MKPPVDLTPSILDAIENISRLAGRCEGLGSTPRPTLQRGSRIRAIRATLAIEGTTVTEEQVGSILDGQRAVGPAREITEARNAARAYELLPSLSPASARDFLKAHRTMMQGLIETAGRWRRRDVGVMGGSHVRHVPPPSSRVEGLMQDLFSYVRKDRTTHPLIKACVVHYEVELIHPFEDGNGRMGRLWQSLMFSLHIPMLAHVPVESAISDRRRDYYEALARSDSEGSSTAFVEFALHRACDAMLAFVDEYLPERDTPESRLARARDKIGTQSFSRKDYMKALGTISSATASRDLRLGTLEGILEKMGERALTIYRFI